MITHRYAPLLTKAQKAVLIEYRKTEFDQKLVAKNLHITINTLKTHLIDIRNRLGLKYSIQAYYEAEKAGLLE